MDERIIEIIEDESKSAPSTTSVTYVRVGKDKVQYDLFFTDRRIIAATVFSQSEISDFGPLAAFQSVANWKKMRKRAREEFKGKTPKEIINIHKDSFDLAYDKIKSIRIKKGLTGAKLKIEANLQGNPENINLKIPKKKIDNVETLLHTYLPGLFI
jgi:hypothetical protein